MVPDQDIAAARMVTDMRRYFLIVCCLVLAASCGKMSDNPEAAVQALSTITNIYDLDKVQLFAAELERLQNVERYFTGTGTQLTLPTNCWRKGRSQQPFVSYVQCGNGQGFV